MIAGTIIIKKEILFQKTCIKAFVFANKASSMALGPISRVLNFLTVNFTAVLRLALPPAPPSPPSPCDDRSESEAAEISEQVH